MDRNDLELVMAVKDQGSLSAAAVVLNIEPPAVTKRLAALEARLGQRLFQRTTRRVSVTAEGEAMCQHAEALLRGFAELEADLQERKLEPTGMIRLVGTFGFGRLWLGPAVAAFQELYPRIEIQLHLTEQLPDLAHEGFDGAVWLWSVQGRQAAHWVSRRLARNQRVLVASPDYLALKGTPASPGDLQSHSCLLVRENGNSIASSPGHRTRFDVWPLQHTQTLPLSGEHPPVRVKGSLSSNSGELVRDWCLRGRGIMLRSLWDIGPQLVSGQLIRVLPQWSMQDADIYWLAPHRQDSPRRMRLLIDYLVNRFADEPWRPEK